MLRLLNVYSTVVMLIQSSRTNTFTNRKMGLQYWQGDAYQVCILPRSVLERGSEAFKGKGSLGVAQDIACSDTCEHRVKSLGGRGSCYVNNEPRMAAQQAKAIWEAYNSLPSLEDLTNPFIGRPINGFVRVSTWGDVSKLPNQAQLDLLNLVRLCAKHTAYISGFREVNQAWRGSALASCTTERDVLDALRLGWNVYASSKVAQATLKEHLDAPVFACPFNAKNLKRLGENKRLMTLKYGCSHCKVPCDGTRSITSDKTSF